jgi:membrane protease subunit HflC
MNRLLILAVVGIVGLIVAASTFFTVHQTQQVLVTQFGQPIRVIREPGLQVKIPFIQSVIAFDRRLLDYEGADGGGDPGRPAPAERGQLHPLPDHRPAVVLPDRRRDGGRHPWPAERHRHLRRPPRARQRAAAQRALQRPRPHPGRGPAPGERGSAPFGIEVVDVRIRRADLPEQNTQAILQRMQSERERVAREERARGAEEAQGIRANADRERTVLLAGAQEQADVLRGQGEQEAIRIFADAFQRDPNFFQFWRSMQAYREAFSEGESRLLLSPDSEFFRYFRGNLDLGAMGNGAPANGRN